MRYWASTAAPCAASEVVAASVDAASRPIQVKRAPAAAPSSSQSYVVTFSRVSSPVLPVSTLSISEGEFGGSSGGEAPQADTVMSTAVRTLRIFIDRVIRLGRILSER